MYRHMMAIVTISEPDDLDGLDGIRTVTFHVTACRSGVFSERAEPRHQRMIELCYLTSLQVHINISEMCIVARGT